ncbi:unnamed protein product [Musa textilis]
MQRCRHRAGCGRGTRLRQVRPRRGVGIGQAAVEVHGSGGLGRTKV